MALCSQVVDFVGLRLLHDVDQARGVSHIPIVEHQPALFLMWILIEMVNTIGVQQRTTALDAVYFISLVEKELREICAILTGDSSYQSSFQEETLLFCLEWGGGPD